MSDNKNKENEVVNGFLQGVTVDLVPLNSEHAKIYHKWVNNAKVRRLARNALPSMVEAEKKFLDGVEERQQSEISFEIWHKKDKNPIGFCGLHQISWTDRRGEIGLSIGEPEYWSKGIAYEAAKIIVDYCFKELNFHKVITMAAAPNENSWKVSEKLGMKRDGALRDHIYVDGEYVDGYEYSILKNEWLEREKSKK